MQASTARLLVLNNSDPVQGHHLPELEIVAEVLYMNIAHLVVRPQHTTQHRLVLVLRNGDPLQGHYLPELRVMAEILAMSLEHVVVEP